MDRQLFPEWRKQNSATKYPFGDAATMSGDDGYVILEGTFLDAVLYPVGGQEGLHLSLVSVTSDTVTVWIGDKTNKALASGEFSLVDPPANVILADAWGRPAGILVSEPERLGVFQSWGVGDHRFKPAQTEFAASVCMPTPEDGLRGVLLADGSLMVGDVWLVGDDGVVLSPQAVPGTMGCSVADGAAVRVDVVGDALFRRRLCEESGLFSTPKFIKSVRVVYAGNSFTVTPDARGNIQVSSHEGLVSDAALRVRGTASGLVIEFVGSSSF